MPWEKRSHAHLRGSSKNEINSKLKAVAELDGKCMTIAHVISYDHIPTQTLLPGEATPRISLKRGSVIGYIMGAGEEVPPHLGQWAMRSGK
jgi:hypothetical protein